MNDTHSAPPPPPITGVTHMFLSVVLFVNKFYYRLSGSEKTTYILKPFFKKINDIVMKTLVLYVKEKKTYIKISI